MKTGNLIAHQRFLVCIQFCQSRCLVLCICCFKFVCTRYRSVGLPTKQVHILWLGCGHGLQLYLKHTLQLSDRYFVTYLH
jgi:hypothetical protein